MSSAKADVAARAGWRGAAFALLTGVAVGLGQAPYALPWLALPALAAGVLLFHGAATPGLAFRRGWTLGAGYALVVMFWIVEPFLVDVARHGWMAPFALGLMAAGFGLFWGGAFWVARRLAGPQSGALLLVLCWAGAEVLRSYAFTGFPWALIGYIWTETPILQLSAFIGPHGLTLLTLAFAAALALAWTRRSILGLAGMATLGLSLGLVAASLANAPVPGDGPRPVIRLVQPNVDQREKWDPAMMPVHFKRQLDLTAVPADPLPDLVVWPEVAVTFLIDDPDAPLDEIAAAGGAAPVVLGAQRFDGEHAYNSIAVLDTAGRVTGLYDKAHLVPFGEYLPLSGLMGRIGLAPLAAQFGLGYSPGDQSQLLDFGPLGTALPLICYEGIFPHEVRSEDRPDWLLLVTNDGWFGTFSGPYQHLAQARARTVELGLPMVRVANTGVSAMIDARGRIIDSLPLGVAGRIDAALPPPLPPTIYARTGDLPMLLLLGFGLAGAAVRRIRLTLS